MQQLLQKLGFGKLVQKIALEHAHVPSALFSPLRDWRILFLLQVVALIGGASFASWVYLQVSAGTFVDAVPLSATAPESLDASELLRVNAALREREAAFDAAFGVRPPVGDPGR